MGKDIHNRKWFWDTMGERIRRIGRIDTDFCHSVGNARRERFLRNDKKKSVRIRPIRSPIGSQLYHNRITSPYIRENSSNSCPI
jgi:hypothetical protein